MPQATFNSVYAISSEDSAHPAINLLKIQPGKKWKTQHVGEKSAYVILQFHEPQKISGIDIGNEHSAFVEVLVGKAGCSSDDFKVSKQIGNLKTRMEILLTCSFMTPIESKNSTNANRVRCFSQNALVETMAAQKWDLVKIICTQPFNKHVQYGLAFIKIHTPEISKSRKQSTKPLVPSQFIQQKTTDNTKKIKDETNTHDHERKGIGQFVLREESPDSDSGSSVSLFSRWKKDRDTSSKSSQSLSAAAAIRAASSPSSLKTHSELLKPRKVINKILDNSAPEHLRNATNETDRPILDRNRSDLSYTEEDGIGNVKLERRISADQDRLKQENENRKTVKEHNMNGGQLKKTRDVNENENNKKSEYPSTSAATKPCPTRKRPSSPVENFRMKSKMQQVKYLPFNELLKGVVLVISGIQNPDRAELRRKALEMGAKYKPDWDKTCTHLICAFKNTPKYNQVKNVGKIIGRQWIEECYKMKKRFPWRRYALDQNETNKPESEDEIYDISLKPADSKEPSQVSGSTSIKSNSPKLREEVANNVKKRKISADETLALYDVEQDDVKRDFGYDLTSGSDTEEEIEKARRKQGERKIIPNKKDDIFGFTYSAEKAVIKQEGKEDSPDRKRKLITDETDVYNHSTEEEEFTKKPKSNSSPTRRDFFVSKKFFINDKIGYLEKIKLKDSIENFGGEVVNSVSESDFVISTELVGTPSNFKAEILKPLWIYDCNDMEAFVPTERYKVKM